MEKIKEKLKELKLEIIWEKHSRSIYDKRIKIHYVEAKIDEVYTILISYGSNNTWCVSVCNEIENKQKWIPVHNEKDILNYLDQMFTTKGVA